MTTTYADPTRCPDCHSSLPRDPEACPACSLPLTGPTVVSLFSTLQEADRLLGLLRSARRAVPVAVATPTSASGDLTAGSHLSGIQPYPTPHPRSAEPAAGPRLSGASVPKILLSLGAVCLLVAAVTFLAVAWAWLGVGGRTVVLVAFTGTSLGLSVAFHRRALRMAAEALSVVGLGLVALDVLGLRHAGWLGHVDDAHLGLLAGSAVAAAALLLLVATAGRPLAGAALIAPVAVLVAGVSAQADAVSLLPTAVTVAVVLGLGRVGTTLPSRTLQVTALATASLAWLGLVLASLAVLFEDPVTVARYVGHLAGWPLLAATLLAAAVGPVTGMHRHVATLGYAVAGLTGSYAVTLPVLDNEATAAITAVLAVSVVWVGVLLVAPDRLRPAVLLPLAGTLVVPSVAAAELLAQAGRAVLTVGAPFSRPFAVHVVLAPVTVSPLLLAPTLVTLAAAGCGAACLVTRVRRSTWILSVAGAAFLGATATLPLYDVPLALVVGILVGAATAGVLVAERLSGAAAHATRLGVLVGVAGAALLALPSDAMTTAVLGVGCAMAGWLMRRPDETGAVASLCFPVAFGGLVWAGGEVLGVQQDLRALPVLLVLGALAIWRPQLELETSAAVVGTLACVASVAGARDLDVALAVYLTVAGTLVTASSIIHPSRRLLAWPGGILLAAATWVRLLDLGVHVVEAYTLPSALVLVGVGAWRLRSDDRSATLSVLAPGLALATVPSLVAALDDPYSLRALLLGLACLGLVIGGAAERWSAPLTVGAVVGVLLVTRELAPYAGHVPTWLTIGASGALLLVAGTTWERRMNDVRRASRYLAALR